MKQGIPERKILIHVENAGDTNLDVAFCDIKVLNFLTVKEQVIFIFVNILTFYLICTLVVENPFTLVSRVKLIATSEGVARNIAMVLTAFTLQLPGFVMS